MRRMIRTSRLQVLFRLGIAIAVALLAAAAVILVLRKSQYDQLQSDYEAARQAAALIEWYVETGEVPSLPEEVTGFGIYDREGDPIFSIGTAPEAITVLHGREEVTRDGNRLRLIRPLAGRFGTPAARGQRRMLPSPISQQFVLLDYDLTAAARRQRLENGALIASGVLIAGVLVLIIVLYRRLQEAFRQQEKERGLAQLGAAARTLAHEIRNPLTAAQMQTELLRRDSGDRDTSDNRQHNVAKRLDVIDEELSRIKDLTEQVREFIKGGPGIPQRISVGRVANAVADRLPFEIQVTDTTAAEPAQPGEPFVRIDEDRLRSVCGNLMRNAFEATESREVIEVTISRRRDKVVLRVADRGTGIPVDRTDQVFDPFFTTKEHGSGVGLAITRRFVEEASGEIEVKQRPGGGTEMIVTLPEDK